MLKVASILGTALHTFLPLLLAAAPAAVAQSPSVTWGAAANNFVEDKPADLLNVGSLVLIGTFDLTMTQIRENQDPAFLFNHFATFGTSSIGSGATNTQGVPQEGAWQTTTQRSTATTHLGDNSGTLFPVAGQRIYVWVFNAPTIAGATEQGLFSLSPTLATPLRHLPGSSPQIMSCSTRPPSICRTSRTRSATGICGRMLIW
jgi:hypothetical protein